MSDKIKTITYIRPSGEKIEPVDSPATTAYAKKNGWLTEAEAKAKSKAN